MRLNRTAAETVGGKLKKVFRGDNDRQKENEYRGSGKRGKYIREHFQVEDDSDWLWGSLLLLIILFALSPGVLLTLPPGRGSVWMSGNTSMAAAFVHALLITILFNFI